MYVRQVATSSDGEDTAWLLTVLRGHIGNASLHFFASYMMPLQAARARSLTRDHARTLTRRTQTMNEHTRTQPRAPTTRSY
eukprot:902145-Pleurochrysis_carterae.AAC.1